MLKEKLEKLKEEVELSIEHRVIQDILDWENEDDMKSYIETIYNTGCINGDVFDLIYYFDAIRFYNTYCNDIWELINIQADAENISAIEWLSQAATSGTLLKYLKDIVDDETFKYYLSWLGYSLAMERIYGELYHRETKKDEKI